MNGSSTATIASIAQFLVIMLLLAGGAARCEESANAPVLPRDPQEVATTIDREIDARLALDHISAAPQADDAEFLRRVFLDLNGKLPTAARAEEFLNDRDPDKRRRLIDELLDSPDYGRHFSIIWQDLILPRQNDIQFLGLVGPDGVKGFGRWLERGFQSNQPWDQMTRELIAAEGTIAENPAVVFTMSHMERAQVRPDLLGVSTARLFLGVQLQCVECHDHVFNNWKQHDFWGLAAFFGRTRFQATQPFRPGAGSIIEAEGMRRGSFQVNGPAITIPKTGGNKGAGKVVRAKFLSGNEPQLDESEAYRGELTKWITSSENRYFAPATVNRWWAHFFGRGIVHPIDDMQEGPPATHPQLLELLTQELRESKYDLKHLIRCLCNSRAYQRRSATTVLPKDGSQKDGAQPESLLLSHMPVKVMSPDVLYDSLLQVLEVKQLDWDLPETLRVALPPAERARLRFVRFFRTRAADADEFTYGVPHALSLMNSADVNTVTPAAQKLANLPAEKAIERLYLVTLARRPTDDERKLLADYLATRKASSPAEDYSSVLWLLINSSEFVLNH